jgi:cation diffusion facilitator family transporter
MSIKRSFLTRLAWLSIATALLTIGLKSTAYFITGSVALLSDALEGSVNLAAGVMALLVLKVAARPADEDHAYGHGKAEYFSSGVEGTLILLAAISIGVAAIGRLIHPHPLEAVSLGLAVSLVASSFNLATALVLLRAGRKHACITLEADGHHLLADVWTAGGIVVGLALATMTGWYWLDSAIAFLVAANIVRTGFNIVRRSVSGLMDTALEPADRQLVLKVLDAYRGEKVQFHALRTRQAGARRFVSMHVLVPGQWTVQRGHELLEQIERDVRKVVPHAVVFTHLESLDDPTSWDDTSLDRQEKPPSVHAAIGK